MGSIPIRPAIKLLSKSKVLFESNFFLFIGQSNKGRKDCKGCYSHDI